MHYLTVQDILWINLQVTEKVHHYNFAKLEEATYYQYSYGESGSLIPQTARFLTGFPRLQPIDAGNDATTFVGLLTFLKLNGMEIDLKDSQAVAWYESVKSKQADAQTAIKSIVQPVSGHDHAPEIRKTVRDLVGDFPCTILALNKL